MLAVECCIKSNGFASLDADELFFINGGSGSYGDNSISGGNISQTGNGVNIAISANYGNQTISIQGASNVQSAGNGNASTSSSTSNGSHSSGSSSSGGSGK